MVTYTEETLFPSGRYQGQRLKDVPASHFVWLYDTFGMPPGPLKDWIKVNLDRLRKDAKRQAKQNSR